MEVALKICVSVTDQKFPLFVNITHFLASGHEISPSEYDKQRRTEALCTGEWGSGGAGRSPCHGHGAGQCCHLEGTEHWSLLLQCFTSLPRTLNIMWSCVKVKLLMQKSQLKMMMMTFLGGGRKWVGGWIKHTCIIKEKLLWNLESTYLKHVLSLSTIWFLLSTDVL